MVSPPLIGSEAAGLIDFLFLPTLLLICVREVVAGKKWADLKVVAGLGMLSIANGLFHWETVSMGAPDFAPRFGVAAYVCLIIVVGGRILPSFTRNWLAKQGRTDFPVPYARYDVVTILASVLALALWATAPEGIGTTVTALVAGVLQAVRLYRWRGWTTIAEPIVLILHVAYLFVPLGFLSIAASSKGVIDPASGLHVLTVGTIATMMLAVMTRATRGHTGRELASSWITNASYAALVFCAFVRPLTGVFPTQSGWLYPAAGLLWMAAFCLYLHEHAPMLLRRRRQPAGSTAH